MTLCLHSLSPFADAVILKCNQRKALCQHVADLVGYVLMLAKRPYSFSMRSGVLLQRFEPRFFLERLLMRYLTLPFACGASKVIFMPFESVSWKANPVTVVINKYGAYNTYYPNPSRGTVSGPATTSITYTDPPGYATPPAWLQALAIVALLAPALFSEGFAARFQKFIDLKAAVKCDEGQANL